MSTVIDSKEIGRRIREFRQKAGFSQERLAELIDMSFQQVQKYENGSSKINTEKLQVVAEALGVSIYAFFDGYIDAPYKLSPEEKRLVESFRSNKNVSIRNAILTIAEQSVI